MRRALPAPLDVHQLVAAERAARRAATSARWWYEIRDAAETTVSPGELDTLFRQALTSIQAALHADAVCLLIANAPATEMVARLSVGLSEEVSLGMGIRTGEGLAGAVMASRSPVVVHDLSTVSIASAALRESGLRSAVAVPLIAADHLYGVLHADSYQVGYFTSTDAEVLEALGDHLAAALDRVRLFESERTARQSAELAATRLALVQRMTAELSAATTAEDVATAVAEQMIARGPGIGIEHGTVWLIVDDVLHRFPSNRVGPAQWSDTSQVPLASGMAVAVAARTGQALYGRDIVSDPQWPGTLGDESLAKEKVALLPLVRSSRTFGVLEVIHAREQALGDGEWNLLRTVADQVVGALERAQLRREREQLSDLRTFLSEAGKVVGEAFDFVQALDRLAELALPALGDLCLIDVLADDGTIRRLVARHRDPSRQWLLDELRERFPPDRDGPHPAVTAMLTGKSQWSPQMSEELLRATTRDDEHYRLTRELQFRSFINVPLRSDAEVVGAITFVSSLRTFSEEDVDLAEALAHQIATVVGKARRFDEEYRTSHLLQRSLLPSKLPQCPGVDIAVRYVPSTRGLEVGGDFYDVVILPSRRLGVVIGDVAGHDREAAAMMGQLRSAIRTLAGQVREPAELIDALRWSWDLLGFDRIATTLLGRLDPATGDLVMASAGHLPPILSTTDNARFLDVVPSSPLGAPGSDVVEWRGRLGPGEALLMLTDGALGERRWGIEEGMKRLVSVIGNGPVDCQTICERVTNELGGELRDDLALLAIGR